MTRSVLVIDDNEGVRTALQMLFSVHDIPCLTAETIDEGLTILRQQPVGLLVQDMNFSKDTTSGKEGVELFNTVRDLNPDLPVILLTAWTHLETAVDLVKAGAADYLSKPWDDEKLVTTARNLLELNEATERELMQGASRRERRAQLEQRYDLCDTIFESDSMRELIAVAVKVSPSTVPILITGPNGAGKEKIAEIVHANSTVANGPLIKVNVGALPADLIESELFGAEAGAYTGATKARQGRFEAADGGTLFLDEIANLSLDGQAKLLRVLQTGEFERLGSSKTRKANVRVVSATNSDLVEAVAQGAFREDLYYRLNVIELEVPSLNDRPADILPLAWHFLPDGTSLDTAAESALQHHHWSGNVRELQNTIKRASLLTNDATISTADLALPTNNAPPVSFVAAHEPDKAAIELAMQRAGGVVAKAARDLGLSRQALYRRMSKFGIQH